MIAQCIVAAVLMFILGTITGIFAIGLVSGGSYDKGYEDGFEQCRREEELH